MRLDTIPVVAPVLAHLQDIFCVLALTGVLLAVVNRLAFRPGRFRGSHRGDALLILGWIAALLACMELNYATLIAERSPEALGADRPLAAALGHLFTPLGSGSAALVALHGLFFWAHLVLVFGFLVYLGYSKHLHIVTAPANVVLREQGPRGRLRTVDIDAVMSAPDERDQHFGAGALEDLSWKDVLDLYTCTECGRCQSHCPAYLTGKPLSPKMLITDLRGVADERPRGRLRRQPPQRPRRRGPGPRLGGAGAGPRPVMWVTGGGPGSAGGLPGSFQPSWLSPDQVSAAVARAGGGERPLIGGAIAEETLWSCTMCGACMDQCPVFIEHVPKIAEMRRHLVLDEWRLPREAETALRAIENVANPYGISHQRRTDWAAGLDVPTLADRPDAEYVYWVGCAAAFDERARSIAVSLVAILRTAQVDFAVLGSEERCTGDPRAGSATSTSSGAGAAERRDPQRARGPQDRHQLPSLFQHARQRVSGLRRPVPGDPPHRLLDELIKAGRIVLERPLDETVTSRLLLPGPVERRLRPTPRDPRAHSGSAAGGEARSRRKGLLRSGRRPDVDGGGRAPGQPPPARPGPGDRRHPGGHRLPLLPGDVRRGDRRPGGRGAGRGR